MKTTEEKILLIISAAKTCIEREHKPDIQIIIREYSPKNDEKTIYTTDIRSVFPDGKICNAGDRLGMAFSIDEALDGSIVCLQDEIENRIRALNDIVDKLKETVPPEKRKLFMGELRNRATENKKKNNNGFEWDDN
jgi:hypothetical protein